MKADTIHIRDWKHRWLNADGWDAFDVWMNARWNPLDAEDRLAFVLQVAGTNIEHSLLIDEFGELVDDCMLSVEAYVNDPELPVRMIMPTARIPGDSIFAK